MAKGYIGNASSKAYPLSKGWVGNGSNKAYPLKAGWMGDANGKARKVFGAAGYIWQKYAVTTTQEYQEVAGESTTVRYNNRFCVGSSYSFDADTGQFTVRQLTRIDDSSTGASNAIGKYYIELSFDSGTYSGTTLYLITSASFNMFSGFSLTVTPYTAELTTIQAKGDLLGTVTAEDITTYPLNGVADDGYWYVLQGVPELTYSGSYSYSVAAMSGQNYLLLEITGSGTYSSTQATTADVWICGGGGGGKRSLFSGSGGGYTAQADNQSFTSIVVTVGSGGSGSNGGTTSISGDISLSANGGEQGPTISSSGGQGGSGGGGSNTGPGGAGQGTTTYLFADSSLPLYCGGGGGMGKYSSSGDCSTGGAGGSNGSDGGSGVNTGIGGSCAGGAGGAGGGGAGGDGHGSAAGNATDYGGGGGGASEYGSGYQGVCFIRIPLN